MSKVTQQLSPQQVEENVILFSSKKGVVLGGQGNRAQKRRWQLHWTWKTRKKKTGEKSVGDTGEEDENTFDHRRNSANFG